MLAGQPVNDQIGPNKSHTYQLKLYFPAVHMHGSNETLRWDHFHLQDIHSYSFFREHKQTTDWNVRAEEMNKRDIR